MSKKNVQDFFTITAIAVLVIGPLCSCLRNVIGILLGQVVNPSSVGMMFNILRDGTMMTAPFLLFLLLVTYKLPTSIAVFFAVFVEQAISFTIAGLNHQSPLRPQVIIEVLVTALGALALRRFAESCKQDSRKNSTSLPQSRHSISSFTLIELLVVIGIIAVLASILFPVFARVREEGRRTVCISNLRQNGLALQLYQQDYETYPASMGALVDAGYIKTTSILVCPSDILPAGWGSIASANGRPGGSPEKSGLRLSYLYGKHVLEPGCWRKVQEDPTSSLLICQTHGQRTIQNSPSPLKDYSDWEGRVLQLHTDGSVKSRNYLWKRLPVLAPSTFAYTSDPMVIFGEGNYDTITCSSL
jgi:prepilin-type N-terminal cleavage/methylation domain-containing protein